MTAVVIVLVGIILALVLGSYLRENPPVFDEGETEDADDTAEALAAWAREQNNPVRPHIRTTPIPVRKLKPVIESRGEDNGSTD